MNKPTLEQLRDALLNSPDDAKLHTNLKFACKVLSKGYGCSAEYVAPYTLGDLTANKHLNFRQRYTFLFNQITDLSTLPQVTSGLRYVRNLMTTRLSKPRPATPKISMRKFLERIVEKDLTLDQLDTLTHITMPRRIADTSAQLLAYIQTNPLSVNNINHIHHTAELIYAERAEKELTTTNVDPNNQKAA